MTASRILRCCLPVALLAGYLTAGAQARIPEYWIVNPADEQIMVLRLEGGSYVEHHVAARGSRATSALLEGFAVDVAATLDAL